MKELEKNQRLALASSMRRVPYTIENEEKGTTYDTIKWRTSIIGWSFLFWFGFYLKKSD